MPSYRDRPSSGTILDVRAVSMYSATTANSNESFHDSKDDTCIIHKLFSYEVPETLKCKFGENTCKIQEFMNPIGSSISRVMALSPTSGLFLSLQEHINDLDATATLVFRTHMHHEGIALHVIPIAVHLISMMQCRSTS